MDNELIKLWKAEEKNVIEGWDFSRIADRWVCPEPDWDYITIVKTYLKDTDKLLDMGTGGGEILLTIGHPYENTTVTEAYLPNLELCRSKLAPLGITVAQTYVDDKLPFEDNSFDFVINRHESFDLNEVNRVLKKGGYFITQQVGNKNSGEIRQRLNGELFVPYSEHEVHKYANTLQQLGYQIIKTDECTYTVKFFDVGAIVFYATSCIWEVPGFTVKSHVDKLLDCQKEIEANGFVPTTGHRFIIVSQKI